VKPADSTAELGRLTSVFLVVLGLLSLFEVGVILHAWRTGTPYLPPRSPEEGIDAVQLLFAGTVCVWGGVALAAAVLFLLWLSKTMRRQRSASAAPPPARRGLALAARVLSWVVPYPQLKEVFAAEGTEPGDRDPQLELWLACVVLIIVLGLAQFAFQGRPLASVQSGLFNALTCARELLLAAAALLAARFVSEVERRRERGARSAR
jgi:hypothetical protein